MLSTPNPKTCRLASLLGFLATASAQSFPGASLLVGGGAPGAASYQLVDAYEPSVFFDKFNFYSSYDPTYGHVQYVNESVAMQNRYSTVVNNSAILSVDTTNRWPRGGAGRPALRLISQNTYTHGLFILDVAHMPYGCGTWPAYWLLGPNWPYNGEIDIIEGVNTIDHNSISMHTSPGCSINATTQTGHLDNANCDSSLNGNSGCGTSLSNTLTPGNYGEALNDIGGGVYVTEWTSNYVKHWFFPRDAIPSGIFSGSPDPSTFGVPAVDAQGNCNIDAHFSNMSIIINTDFCGAWAGQAYQYGYPNCPQNASAPSSLDSCVDYVGNNPSAFVDAYWQINSIRVYQMPLFAQASSSYSTRLSAPTDTAAPTNTINQGMGGTTSTLSSSAYTGPLSSATATTVTSGASASAIPAFCPDRNNTVWTDRANQQYTIRCNADHAGDNLAQYSANSFEHCLELCDTMQSCGAVTYLVGNGAGNCYLKPGNLVFVYSNSNNAAMRVSGAVSVSSSMSTSLNPVSIPPLSTPASTTSTVSSASIVMAPSGTSCPGVDNTQITDSNGLAYTIHCNQDIDAGAFASQTFSGGGYTLCLAACDAQSGCNAFSWVPYSNAGGVCYFKTTTQRSNLAPASNGIVCGVQGAVTSAGLSSRALSSPTAISSSLSVTSTFTSSATGFSSSAGTSAATSLTRSLSTSVSSTSGASSSSSAVTSSVSISSSRATTSSSSSTAPLPIYSSMSLAPPCPTSTASICSSPSDSTTCSSSGGQNYNVTCGLVYEGTVIDTSLARLRARAIEPTYPACQSLCDGTQGCVALNYIGTNCTLLSSVTGTTYQPGAVGGTVVSPAAVVGITTVSATSTAYTTTSTLSPSFGATVTFVPTTTVISTLPMGGTFTSGSSGSYYIYTTSNAATESAIGPPGSVSVCFTCALTPVLTSGDGAAAPTTSIVTSVPSTCSAMYPRSGTTTIFTTTTITSCILPMTCPASGYIIGSGPSQSGNIIVTTTNGNGEGITYTQIPTSTPTSSVPGNSATPNMGLPNCPGSDGEDFTATMGNVYRIACDQIFTDDTITTQTVRTLATCFSACDNWNVDHFTMGSQCLGVSFDETSNTNNCLLKAGASTQAPMFGFVSGRLMNPRSPPASNGSQGIGGDAQTTVPTFIVTGGSTVYATVTDGSGPGTGPGNSVPHTTVVGGSTVYSTYTSVSGVSTVYGTATLLSGGSTVISTALATSTAISVIPSTVYGISTAISTVVSNGVTIVTQVGVTTAISVSYAPASTNTVTTTTVSVSISDRVSTALATQTVVGPTVTASVGGGTGGTGGGVVTVTQGGGGSGGIITVTAAPITVTSYAPPQSSSSSVFTCLTYSTNYLPPGASNPGPYRKKRRSIFDMDAPRGLDIHDRIAMPAARAHP